MITLKVNGQDRQVDVDPATPLLWVLRDTIGLAGTKYGCGIAACGACTVLVDGKAEHACMLPVKALAHRNIVTIEGLAGKDALHPLQEAWIAEDAIGCGYCQTGQIMAAAALLKRKPHPDDADIDAAVARFRSKGIVAEIRHWNWGITANFLDPDGNHIELRDPFHPAPVLRPVTKSPI